jgi:cystathionine gamma-synthase
MSTNVEEAPGSPHGGLSPATVAITAGRPDRRAGAPVNEPVTLTSTYVADGAYVYARADNPGWDAFEATVGALEGGEAVVYASGIAAVAAVLSTLPVGARVVVPRHSYAGTLELLDAEAARGALVVERVDVLDAVAVAVAADGAALVLLESPTNPAMEVVDLVTVIAAAHAGGAIVAVDNTFATPLLQRPLDLGADLVVHSASKFLGGHSDVILGVALTRDAALLAELRAHRTLHGAIAGPLETFLALRGVRTLPVRLRQSQASAQVLAERLQAHPAVSRVRYPGLLSDPGHDLAARQMDGFGAMLAIEHADGAHAAEATCAATRVWTHATSLGGVESTLERRRRTGMEPATIPDALIRLSVGCEDVEDLWRDLDQALRSSTLPD